MIESLSKSNKRAYNELFYELNEYVDINEENIKQVYLYNSDGEYAGLIVCGLRDKLGEQGEILKQAVIEGLYVLPEYRGGGIASELIDKFEFWAVKKGCTDIKTDYEEGLNLEKANFFSKLENYNNKTNEYTKNSFIKSHI